MSKKTSLLVGVGFAALLAGGVYYAKSRAASQVRPSRDDTVSVVTGQVSQHDTPIYLDGIGTVQAYNTVTIAPLVSGQLTSIDFTEGQMVKAGDLLAVVDPRSAQAQLDAALAKQAQDAATLANAKLDLDRDTYLLAQNVANQQTVDTQKSLVAQTEALVQADAASVESARVQLTYTRVTAPIAGRLGLRLVDNGNIVTANTTGIVVITQLQPISVVFTLPQQNLAQLQKASAAGSPLKVIAYDQDSAHPIDTGELSVISNQIDTSTGTISCKATFPNADNALWPGQFVNIRLLIDTRKDGIVVPASVVQIGPQGDFAFVVNTAKSTVSTRSLKVVQIEDGVALLDSGLSPGETVIVDGQYKLQDGSHVTIAPPAGQPAGKVDASAPAAKHDHKKKSVPSGNSSDNSVPSANSQPTQ